MPDDGKIIMCQIREKIEKFFYLFSAQSIEGGKEEKKMVKIICTKYALNFIRF